MDTEKRQRGRPRGSGKDDSGTLARVADLLVCEPSLKATTAMKRILPERDWGASDATTLVRRLQAKWKSTHETELAAARERARPKIAAPVASHNSRPTFLDVLHSPQLAEAAQNFTRQWESESKAIAETAREMRRQMDNLACSIW